MRSFDYIALKEQKWDSEIVGYIAAIHESKGKQDLYLKHRSQELDKLVEIAKIQSAETSNAIEGIHTTNTRLKQILLEQCIPKTCDEEEIAGYRDVLKTIHENYEYITLTPNYILQLHKILFGHSAKSIGGKFKNVQNYINATDADGKYYTLFTPLAPDETSMAMNVICKQYTLALGQEAVDPLILIPVFIHDFLCIHPFSDGNGRMGRLLTTLLLYKSGYMVGKYISLESKIAKNKDLYYDALAAAQIGWHDGKENVVPFIKYLLSTIIATYRNFEERLELVSEKMSALVMVRKAVQTKIGKFTKAEICELCPLLSVSSVEASIRKLVASDEIVKRGAGRSTVYFKRN